MDRRKLMRSALVMLPIIKSPLLLASLDKPTQRGALQTSGLDNWISSPEHENTNYYRVLIEVNRKANNGLDRDQVKPDYMKGDIQVLNKKYLQSGRMVFTVLKKDHEKVSWEYTFTSKSDYQAWQKEVAKNYIDYDKAHALGLREKITVLTC